ncbi:MAG: AI-2E family transporter [Alphaproteobacteria bacterium]|nr:AI-2E family transporter [Alphaproteobacteria bacterium]
MNATDRDPEAGGSPSPSLAAVDGAGARGARADDSHEIAHNWLLGGLLVAALMTLLTVASAIAIPVVMAVFISAVLRTPVRILMNWRVPQPIAAGGVVLVAVALVALLVTTLYAPAADWAVEAPNLIERVEKKLTPIKKTIAKAQDTAEKIEKATDLSGEHADPVVTDRPSLLERAFDTSRLFLVQVALVLVLVFFVLAHPAPIIPDRLIKRLGARGQRVRKSLVEIEAQMSRYMGTIALTNGAVGALTALAMYICGMPSPLLWGVIAALLGFVPYIGPILTASIIGAVAFLNFETWTAILAPVGAYLVLHFVESDLVTPMLIGRFMTVHPVAVFIFVLIWTWMWGLAGAFLAVPILAACVVTLKNLLIDEKRTLSDFMLDVGGFRFELDAPFGDGRTES